MVEAGMTELQTIGRSYTWSNNHTYSSIDRAIVNSIWMTTMPPLSVQVMDPIFSDHSLHSIELGRSGSRCKRAFRFMNCIAEHSNFISVVEESWSQTNTAQYIEDIWDKLKHVKTAIKELNIKDFVGVIERLKDNQEDMRITNHPHELFEAEKELRIHLKSGT